MTTKKQITADLDKLVKRAAEVRVGAIKAAAAAPEGKSLDIAKGEKVDAVATDKDGKAGPKGSGLGTVTTEPITSKTVGAVEKAAEAAPEGKSLDVAKGEKVDAQATAPNGQEGPKGSELGTVTKKPTTSAEMDVKAAAAAPEGKSLDVAKGEKVDAVATAADGQEGPKGSELGTVTKKPTTSGEALGDKVASAREFAAALRKEASDMLSPLDKFLVKAARAHTDPQVKLAAEQMPDDQLADASSDDLMSQLATGQIGEEDAKQILEEALQSGAITEEELSQAIRVAQQQGGAEGGAPADAGAPPADAGAPPADVGPETGAPPEAAPMDDAGAPPMAGPEAKIAAADEKAYLTKIASDHADEVKAGEDFFHKLAELLVKSAEEAEEKKEEKHEESESPEKEKKEEAGAKLIDSMSGVNLKPADEAEKQALAAVQQELGLDDAKLAELAGAQVSAPQDKVAAAKVAYRTAFLSKIAALKK